MSEVTRRAVAAPPTPANWFSVRVNSLTVYRTPQDDSYTENQMHPRTDADGLIYYRDPQDPATNTGWYSEGQQPEGWQAELVSAEVLVPRTKRGEVTKVQIIEQDADGNPIPESTEGYPAFRPFDTDGLRNLAQANLSTVGVKYEAAIVALQELADAICVAANAGE